jgi:hypothetical protein
MKKLKLQMEDLAVESFTTDGASPMRGTVEAHNTFRGNTCGAVNTCGPQTCPPMYCVIETGDPLACGASVGCVTPACPPGTNTCPTGGGLSCVGCTTQNYTANLGDDTCGFCMSFGSDVPARCPCP